MAKNRSSQTIQLLPQQIPSKRASMLPSKIAILYSTSPLVVSFPICNRVWREEPFGLSRQLSYSSTDQTHFLLLREQDWEHPRVGAGSNCIAGV